MSEKQNKMYRAEEIVLDGDDWVETELRDMRNRIRVKSKINR